LLFLTGASGYIGSPLPPPAPAACTPDALLGLADDADLDHALFREECGYAPLTLEQGFAPVFGGGEAVR
jgi:hypothetical protein